MTEPHPSTERWADYLAGRVGGDAAAALDAHLLECPACTAGLAALSPAGSAFVDRLRAADGTGAYHAEPAAESNRVGPAVIVGTVVAGRYKLVEEIGEGGMGSVWMAQQTEPVRRAVAVKLIKPGMDSKAVLARFEAERQALALMDHPNIARVFDGGLHEGRPFFVMELVKGVPITRFCDDRRLTPQQRLELFVPVCQALQHAHQKGVIHRDIKPSNVLIALYDDKPVPKVIDFGVAKAAGAALTDRSLMTGFGAVVGTPEYMSPEQAGFNQLDVDTRSDVYSLGVLLYELLTGTTPVDRQSLRHAAVLEVLRIVREVEPPRPSAKLSTAEALPTIAANRHTEPAKLTALLRRELDWVVMKALEKDRSRRYETVNALARDLQRYLADEVVEARPPTAGYRLRKFVKRNKGRVTAAALVLLALVGGIVGTTLGLVEAREQRNAADAARTQADNRLSQVEKANDILGSIFKDLDPRSYEKTGQPLQAILGQRLDQAATQIEAKAIGDPLTVARMQVTLGISQHGLGRPEKAIPLLAAARPVLANELGPTHRDTLACMNWLAASYLAAKQYDEARELHEETLKLREVALGPDDPDTIESMNDLSAVFLTLGDAPHGLPLAQEAHRRSSAKLPPTHPLALLCMSNLAAAYVRTGKPADGIPLLEKAVELSSATAGPEHPDTLTYKSLLAGAYSAAGRNDAALPLFQETLRVRRIKLGAEHPSTRASLFGMATAYVALGKLGDAQPYLTELLDTTKATASPDSGKTYFLMNQIANAYMLAGQRDFALPLYRQAVEGVERLNFEAEGVGIVVTNFSNVFEMLGRYPEAEKWRRVWLKLLEEQVGTSHRYYVEACENLANNLSMQQKWADATSVARRVAEVRRKTPGPESPEYATAMAVLGYYLLQQGKWADAEPVLRESLTIRTSKQPNNWTTFNVQSLLGGALAGQQNYNEAMPLLLDGYVGMKRRAAQIKRESRVRLPEAAFRLMHLAEATGDPAGAAKWLDEAWAWCEAPDAKP